MNPMLISESTGKHKGKSISHFEDVDGNELHDLHMINSLCIIFTDGTGIKIDQDYRGQECYWSQREYDIDPIKAGFILSQQERSVAVVEDTSLLQQPLMKYDPGTGMAEPYPSHAGQYRKYHGNMAWLFNPWTGNQRNPFDIGSDVAGLLIKEPCDG